MGFKMCKENICINKIVGKKEETFIIDGDEIVPDIKPDVLKIISCNGNVCIYKKEIQDGKVCFDGSVYIYTLYVADDESGSVRSITSSLDFSKTIKIDNVESGMQLQNKCDIKSIECKILNGRKINLMANLNFKVCVCSNDNIDIMKDVNDIADIQKLNKSYNINSLVGSGVTKAFAKDTIKIDSADRLSEIAKVKMNIINKETKISYNKVLVKADTSLKIVYLTEDNKMNSVNALIPIMGFIDIQNVSEENICDISYELKNISIKPNNVDEHSIYVEVEVEISCFAYENKQMQIMQDLYSPTIDLSYNQKQINIMQNKTKLKQTCNIRKQELIPEIGKNKIYDVEVTPSIIKKQIADGRILYDGEINLRFLYGNDELRMETKDVIEPFNFNIADDRITEQSDIDDYIDVSMQDFIVMPDESIDVKVDLDFNLNTSNMENLNIIDEVNESENRNKEKYSIVIYYTKFGDTLWNIAKRFGSTIEDIAKVNKIENPDIIMPGEQLFIPR